MISANSGKGFFAARWHWFAALGGLAALAAAVFFTFVSPSEDEALSESVSRNGAAKVETIATEGLETIFEGVKSPSSILDVPADDKSFLASEFRVFCSNADGGKSCGRPIPYGCEVCPFADCGVKQKKEEKPSFDTDSDGLPDEFEKSSGLDPNDPSDAEGDLDGDGFTNLEEYEAKTDLRDASSHPDYIDSIALKPPLRQTYTTLMLTGAVKHGDVWKMSFKDPSRAKEYDRGNYNYKKEGDDIGATGFSVVKYEQKSKQVVVPGGMKKTEDVSVATIKRKSDGKLVKLRKNAPRTPTDIQAVLACERGGHAEFQVVEGDTFKVRDTTFKVLSITAKGKKEAVEIKNLATGAEKTLAPLE